KSGYVKGQNRAEQGNRQRVEGEERVFGVVVPFRVPAVLDSRVAGRKGIRESRRSLARRGGFLHLAGIRITVLGDAEIPFRVGVDPEGKEVNPVFRNPGVDSIMVA